MRRIRGCSFIALTHAIVQSACIQSTATVNKEHRGCHRVHLGDPCKPLPIVEGPCSQPQNCRKASLAGASQRGLAGSSLC